MVKVFLSKSAITKLMAAVIAAILVITIAGASLYGYYALTPPGTERPPISNPDTLTVAVSKMISNFDPGTHSGKQHWDVLRNIYENLIEIDPQDPNNLIPQLITEVPTVENGLISADHKTFTFHIRQGVKFHNGAELDAYDVAYTIQRICVLQLSYSAMITNCLTAKNASSAVINNMVTVNDKYTVTFRTLVPDSTFIPKLTVSTCLIVNKDYVIEHGGWNPETANNTEWIGKLDAWMTTNAMGTGPFKLSRYDAEDKVILDRFEDYWKGPATLREVVMVKISDGSTRLSMLEKGDADIVEINPKYMSQAQTLKNVNVSTDLVAQYNIVIFSHNIDTSNPFPGSTATSDFYDDIDLRKGIAYAYDYDKYVQVGLGGYGVRLNSFIVPGTEGYDPDIPLYPHDTEKAIEHFMKARNGTVWANGFTIYMISWEGWDEGIVGGEVFKESIEAINPKFRVNHITLPWPTGVARMAKDQMESWAGIWMPRYWSGYDYAENVMYSTGNYGAYSNYYNPEVDQLINQLRSEFNATRRTEILDRLQWIFYDDCVGILQGQFPVFGAQRTWVQGRINDPLTRYQYTYYTISKAY